MSIPKMKIIDDINHIISERGNTYIAFRKVYWGDSDTPKYDLRKYYTSSDGSEVIGKGVAFDEEAANELTETMVNTGLGNTRKLMESLKEREDFDTVFDDSIDDSPCSENFVDIRSEMMGNE